MQEDRYFFNSDLLRNLRTALGISIVDISRTTGLKKSTLQSWMGQNDMPMDKFIHLCNTLRVPVGHFVCAGVQKQVIVAGNYQQREKDYCEAKFLNLEWGDEVTVFSGRSLKDACTLCGISKVSFYRYFRKSAKAETLNLTISQWLNMCNRMKVYPMDFLCPSGVDVPVLEGFDRRKGGANPNKDEHYSTIMAVKERMERAMAQMEEENKAMRETLRECRKEMAELKRELSAKRMKIVELEEELDGRRMKAAEAEGMEQTMEQMKKDYNSMREALNACRKKVAELMKGGTEQLHLGS